MPRKARIVLPGYLHHVTQRGNNRQYLFKEENDYILYLKYVERYRVRCQVEIYAYCIMGNHVHFLVEPKQTDSLARMFRGVHMNYAKYYQQKTQSSGHVWQGRFFSCLMQRTHISKGFRYVECNPVRARMVKNAWDYPWSSARAHLGKKYQWIKLADARKFIDIQNWRKYLQDDEEETFLKDIRQQTRKNLIIGSKDFMVKLEQKLGRLILPKPLGRPRKNDK